MKLKDKNLLGNLSVCDQIIGLAKMQLIVSKRERCDHSRLFKLKLTFPERNKLIK